MAQLLKRLAKMVVGYGAVQWAGPFISFIFTPIITRIVSPSDYGIADYVLTIASAVGTMALFALPQALAAHFNDQPDETWHQCITGSALTLAWMIGIPIGAALAIFAPYLAQFSFGNQRYTFLFQMVGCSIAFGVCSSILTAAAQAALRVRWGMLFSITTIGATVIGNVVFIIALRLGATGMVVVPITTGVVVSLVALVIMRNMIGRASLYTMKMMASSGMLLLPTVLSAWVLMVADRLFLVRYVSTEALGYYAIANRITGLLYVALSPLYTAWTSLALSLRHGTDAKLHYAAMSRYLIAIVLSAALATGLFATEILIILTRPAYLPAAPYVGFLTYVQVFNGFGTVLYISALASKQLKAISWTFGVGAVVNIALNFALIPPYGVWGAVIATVIGYAIPQVLLYQLLQKRYPVPYPTRRLLGALFIQGSLLVLGALLPPLIFPIRIVLKLSILGFFLLALILLGVITRSELQQARLFLKYKLHMALV
jgi:O-antigen/teichoic acid export membrane protein